MRLLSAMGISVIVALFISCINYAIQSIFSSSADPFTVRTLVIFLTVFSINFLYIIASPSLRKR
jgi:hypothetical protein